MPTASSTMEALPVSQQGGPRVLVEPKDIDAFHALQTLMGEDTPPQFIASALLESNHIDQDDRTRFIRGMTEADAMLREGKGIPVLAEVNYSLQVGLTAKTSGIVIRPNEQYEDFSIACSSLDELTDSDGGGFQEDDEQRTSKRPLLKGTFPGAIITKGDDRQPLAALSEAMRCAQTVLVVGRQAVNHYLELRIERELGDGNAMAYCYIPYSEPKDEAGQFAASSSLWALAAFANSGYELPARYNATTRELATSALAHVVAGSAGIISDASKPKNMTKILERLPAIDLTPHAVDDVSDKALSIVQGDGAYDALSGTAAKHGGDISAMIKSATVNVIHHLVGVEPYPNSD